MTLAERNADLEAEIAVLRQERDVARAREAERQREVDALREELEKLRREIEEWKRGFRERGKRRSSRGEKRNTSAPKRPGRKPGHEGTRRPPPPTVDREQHHPTPTRCPCCEGAVTPTEEEVSALVVDIPPVVPETVRHTTRVGTCRRCGQRVVARLPGSTPTGTTVALVTLGPNVQAMALDLRYEVNVPLGKIGSFLGRWCGVEVTASGLFQMFARLRDRSAESYEEVAERVRTSPVVGLDETGMRQNGASGWMWLARTDEMSLFRAELSRGTWVALSMLGEGFAGVVCSDFYGVYTAQTQWTHAFCGAHLERDAKKLAELIPCPETRDFQGRLRAFYEAGARAQQSGQSADAKGARVRLGHLIGSPYFTGVLDLVKLQVRMAERREGIELFLTRPDVPATNNATERDLRHDGRHRAVTSGTRSARGSQVLAHWMTIVQTRKKQDLPLGSFVGGVVENHLRGRPPPSVFHP